MPKTGGNGSNKLTLLILGVLFTVTASLTGLAYNDIKADVNRNTMNIDYIQEDILDIKLYMQGGRTLDSLILDKLTEIEEKLGG